MADSDRPSRLITGTGTINSPSPVGRGQAEHGKDAAAVMRITGVAVGTLNVWINRNLIPGMTVGTQGRARLFDLHTVIHVAIVVALVRLGHAAPFAAQAASLAQGRSERLGAKLIVGPPDTFPGSRLDTSPTGIFVEA